MTIERQIAFWVAALAVLIAALWLLSPVMLPFVAGIALAYLLNPLARRLERVGIHRAVAGLVIILLVVAALIVLVLLLVPVLAAQTSAFIERLPSYVTRLQSLIADSGHEWLTKILGERLPDASKSVGELMSQGASWLATLLRSLWSGGQALVSILSLMVVTPVVAFYMLCDWDRMIVTIDSWVPRPQRKTVRALAREIDAAIAGFVRGQTSICMILGAFCCGALTASFRFPDRLSAGLLSFIPYVGSLTGLCVVASPSPSSGRTGRPSLHSGDLCRWPVAGRLCTRAQAGRRAHRAASGVADVCAVRVRLFVWIRRLASRCAARGGDRCAGSLRAAAVSCKSALPGRGSGLTGVNSQHE